MEFDVNKKYKTRSGLDFEYLNTDVDGPMYLYPISGYVINTDGTKNQLSFTEQGRLSVLEETSYDLVEIEEGIDL